MCVKKYFRLSSFQLRSILFGWNQRQFDQNAPKTCSTSNLKIVTNLAVKYLALLKHRFVPNILFSQCQQYSEHWIQIFVNFFEQFYTSAVLYPTTWRPMTPSWVNLKTFSPTKKSQLWETLWDYQSLYMSWENFRENSENIFKILFWIIFAHGIMVV